MFLSNSQFNAESLKIKINARFSPSEIVTKSTGAYEQRTANLKSQPYSMHNCEVGTGSKTLHYNLTRSYNESIKFKMWQQHADAT